MKLHFVEHLSMTASERIKFFTKSIGGQNKVVISEAFISGCSNVKRIQASSFNFMLKEPI